MIEGKGEFPDILLCGHWPLTIVSGNVLAKWNENNITGYESYKVRLFRKSGEEIPDTEVSYYNIIITNQNELDFDAMSIKLKAKCEVCGREEYNKPNWKFGKAIIKKSSWIDFDLFVFKHFEYVNLGSLKTLEVIYKNKLTNFRFSDFEDMFDFTAEDIILKELFKK